MIYLMHFSFEENHVEKPRHGYLTCLVEADNVGESLKKFRDLIHGLRRDGEIFQTATSIYLDDLVQIKKIPSEGLLAHMVARKGELPDCISSSLPGVDEKYCESFSPTPDSDDEEQVEIEPFMTFE